MARPEEDIAPLNFISGVQSQYPLCTSRQDAQVRQERSFVWQSISRQSSCCHAR